MICTYKSPCLSVTKAASLSTLVQGSITYCAMLRSLKVFIIFKFNIDATVHSFYVQIQQQTQISLQVCGGRGSSWVSGYYLLIFVTGCYAMGTTNLVAYEPLSMEIGNNVNTTKLVKSRLK